jgi:hypothetical protein
MLIPPRFHFLPAVLVLLAGCETRPEFVYVPAPNYQQGLTVRAGLPADGTVAVGSWITLHANRIMGPWERVHRDEVPDSVTCTRDIPPRSPDLEIASRLRWEAVPGGRVKYNMPNAPDWDRKIQFTEPGEYRLWAISDGPCGGQFVSDTLRLVVR